MRVAYNTPNGHMRVFEATDVRLKFEKTEGKERAGTGWVYCTLTDGREVIFRHNRIQNSDVDELDIEIMKGEEPLFLSNYYVYGIRSAKEVAEEKETKRNTTDWEEIEGKEF